MAQKILKKVKLHIEGLHSAKLKEEKAAKSKQKGKGKSVKMDLVKVSKITQDCFWQNVRYIIYLM